MILGRIERTAVRFVVESLPPIPYNLQRLNEKSSRLDEQINEFLRTNPDIVDPHTITLFRINTTDTIMMYDKFIPDPTEK